MTLQEQADILAAALAGKTLERCRRTFPNEWRDNPCTPNTGLNFQDYIYRVKVPTPLVLHRYIILTRAGQWKMTQFFYSSPEEALKHCMSITSATSATPAPWTRIEVPE